MLIAYWFGFKRPPWVSICLILILMGKLVRADSNLTDYDDDDDDIDPDSSPSEIVDYESIDVVTSSYDLARLKNGMLFMYDRDSRPLYYSNQSIKVYLRVKFVQINHLDEVLQVMTSTVQLEMTWRDEYLTWNSSLYSNSIKFEPSQIWTPDVTLSNNLNSFKYDTHEETYVVPYGNNIFDFSERFKYFVSVMPNGDCYWSFPIKLMSVCEFKLDEFPFDQQQCVLDFRSSAYLNSQLVLLKWDTGIDMKLLKIGEFTVLGSEAANINISYVYSVNLDEASSHVRIKLTMKRKIIFYINKIVLPYFVFYIVTAFTYAIPVEAGEKKSYSTSILISAMIYLKDISNYIPKTSILPLLTIYFDLNLVLVFICVSMTTFVYMFYYYDKLKIALPSCLKRLIASSKYLRTERRFASSNRLFNSNEIRSNLVTINKQLAKVKKNLNKCDSYFFSLQAAGNSNDCLANEMLSLVITLKIFILNHYTDSTALDIDQALAAVVDQKSTHQDVVYKITELDRKRLGNFHFINTLENLKLHLVKNKRRKQSSGLPRTISLMNELRSESERPCTSKPRHHHHRPKSSDHLKSIYDSSASSLSQDKKSKSVNRTAMSLLNTIGEYKFQIKSYLRKIDTDEQVLDNLNRKKNLHYSKDNSVHEWKYFAIILDRIVLIFFAVLTPICLIIMYLRIVFFD